MTLCDVCGKYEADYFILTISPKMGLCSKCIPQSRRCYIKSDEYGKREPDIDYSNFTQKYPIEECYSCGNNNKEQLNKSGITISDPVKTDRDTGVIPVYLPKEWGYDRWTCKYGFGCWPEETE